MIPSTRLNGRIIVLTATVEKVFQMEIPSEFFSENSERA